MAKPDEPSDERARWLSLSEVAKSEGLACDIHRKAAIETCPLVLRARSGGLERSLVTRSLASAGITGAEAAEIIAHVDEASHIVALIIEAQSAASAEEDLLSRLEPAGRPAQFPGRYEHAFVFHVAFWRTEEKRTGARAPYPVGANRLLSRIRSRLRRLKV